MTYFNSKQVKDGSVFSKLYTVFEQTEPGHPTSLLFRDAQVASYNTYFAARRVFNSHPEVRREQVQIEILLTTKYKSGRSRTQWGSLELNPHDADLLAEAILKVRKYKEAEKLETIQNLVQPH